jgi:hypothetical protein
MGLQSRTELPRTGNVKRIDINKAVMVNEPSNFEHIIGAGGFPEPVRHNAQSSATAVLKT